MRGPIAGLKQLGSHSVQVLKKIICMFDVSSPLIFQFFTHLETSPTEKFDLCSAFIAISQWGFFSITRLLHSFIKVISEDINCRAFGSGAVINCFNDCLSRLGFDHTTFRLQDERSYRLHHCSDALSSYAGTVWL